jgi:cell division protein ZapA
MSNDSIFVKILDKDYQVACPPGQEKALLESARALDERMRQIRNSGSVIGLERIAVMAGLNLSHELLEADQNASNRDLNEESLESLTEKLDQALESFS